MIKNFIFFLSICSSCFSLDFKDSNLNENEFQDKIKNAVVCAKAAYNKNALYRIGSFVENCTGLSKIIERECEDYNTLEINDEFVKESPKSVQEFYFENEAIGKKVAGVVTFDKKTNKITVGFAGTENKTDFYTDLNAFKKKVAFGNIGEIEAHQGFIDRYECLKPSLDRVIMSLLKVNNIISDNHDINRESKINKILHCDNIKLDFTGHSLGGALASLAAVDFASKLENSEGVSLITFNSPRVFSKKTFEKVSQLIGKNSYRLWRKGDPISKVSMGITGYKHIGRSFALDSRGFSLNPMYDHSLNRMFDDIFSEKKIKVDEDYRGIINAFSDGINYISEKISQSTSYLVSSISSAKNCTTKVMNGVIGNIKNIPWIW